MKSLHKNTLAVFESYKIRRHYDEKSETWFFSVVDIIQALTDSTIPRRYWADLKIKLQKEGSELYEKIVQLKMIALDGKERDTDCCSTPDLLRLIQSVPSPKAEPIKLWLAKVGYERMQEIADPELSINRARENWEQHGRTKEWIQRRMMGQETRNKLTDYWSTHGISKGEEFAILTNIIHKEWSGISITDHKKLKGLKKHNLRDHMDEAELIFTALAEMSTRQIADAVSATGMPENKSAAKAGGTISKRARVSLEEKTGKSVVNKGNFLAEKSKKRLK